MKTKTLKMRGELPKPRNPLVVQAHSRKAGRHGKTEKAARRIEKISLKKHLSHEPT